MRMCLGIHCNLFSQSLLQSIRKIVNEYSTTIQKIFCLICTETLIIKLASNLKFCYLHSSTFFISFDNCYKYVPT